jgi:epoxyqueuosine reductase
VTAVDAINPSALALSQGVKARAGELGFDLVGIASADPSARRDYLRHWLDAGQHGSMRYLADRFAERTDPGTYLPGARSVICVAMNYFSPLQPVAAAPVPPVPAGKIARYALGADYHELIKPRLLALADWLRQAAPQCATKAAVDTAPVMEKELAARAGIGWMGKNTCIIHPRLGSWLFLGEVITTASLAVDEPITDHCGTCTRCIDACPTAAITAPYQLDASRCIAYLTIEHRGEIDASLKEKIGDWLFGCDICQDVCPHNRQTSTTREPQLQPRFPTGALDTDAIASWDVEDYRAALRGSAMKRVPLPILQRNAAIVKINGKKIEPQRRRDTEESNSEN